MGPITSFLPYDPEGRLSDCLEEQADVWWQGYRLFWDLDESGPPEGVDEKVWLVWRLYDRLAVDLCRFARSLHTDPPRREFFGDVLRVFENAGISKEDLLAEPIIRHRIEIEAYAKVGVDTWSMMHRVVELFDFLVTVSGKRTKAYLERLADCYIRGMGTEGVVMCRAVLDAALKEFYPDNEIQQAGNASDSRHVTLADRLKHLKRDVRFAGREFKRLHQAADRVRKNGNDAIHDVPDMSDLQQGIADLVVVLNALDEYRPQE